MAMDSRNFACLTGRLTADPEVVETAKGTKIYKFRLAVDFAGNEKGSDTNSGFFDVTHFGNDSQPSAFIAGQVSSGNLKKGSAVSALGRLSQDRWETDGKKNSRVVLVAESINYFGFADRRPEGERTASAAPSAPAEDPTQYVPDRF